MNAPHVLGPAPRSGTDYLDLPTYLMQNRILFLGPELSHAHSLLLTMQMLALKQERGEIHLYVNCFGGSLPAGLAVADVIDTLKHENVPVATYCLGECVGIAAVVLAAGTSGLRRAFPSSRVSLYQEWYGVESMWGAQSQDERERSRLMDLVKSRLLRYTRLRTRALKTSVTLTAEERDELLARFPAEAAVLAALVDERDDKIELDVARVVNAQEGGEIGDEAAEAVFSRAEGHVLSNWLKRLEFLGPEEACECGIVDGLVEVRQWPK